MSNVENGVTERLPKHGSNQREDSKSLALKSQNVGHLTTANLSPFYYWKVQSGNRTAKLLLKIIFPSYPRTFLRFSQ